MDIFDQKRPKIEVRVYWTENDDGNILVDEEGMREEFEEKLKEVLEEAGCDLCYTGNCSHSCHSRHMNA